ncbi:GH51 arabinofuranosidase [Polyplosphaeria fusca]|uniref:non-reducing end alpha-L-arabinofuranosidase n=1 Tax=Polyplosphaeria fusca TaxID=682080 RepID=A0A9P4UYN2_9PLEO|nr:GH51 arabinofuranosidase [Polyplosphaeria fusca]
MSCIAILTAVLALCASGGAVDIAVKSTGGKKISEMPYGLMHEDINNAGDGGLYAELIRNRAFSGSDVYPSNLDGWSAVNGASLSLKNLSNPLSSAIPTSINVAVSQNSTSVGNIGFANDGFWGMNVVRQEYKGSFYVKGEYDGDFVASLKSALTNDTFGSVKVKANCKTNEWTQHKFTLVPNKNAPNSNNTFTLTFSPKGLPSGSASLDFNLISLFPPTYKGRENGLRKDIAETLATLQPKFLRFPGGNALEGPNITHPWQWNETIGDLKDRPGRPGVWNYQTSDGFGLVEYLNWATDMELVLVLGIHSGLAMDGHWVNETDLQPWIDSALDEIEFIRGDVSTPWGKRRAELGYPEPWELKFVEIGNEDWLAGKEPGFDSYKEYRFPRFREAIASKYPDIQLIASPSIFDKMTIPAPVAGDYHPYRQPNNFYNEFHKFDNLTADNLTLVGEFSSVHPNGGIDWNGTLHPYPWWIGGVGEAIFMISTERNGDRILGSTYAPILRNMNRWQWSICMLEFDASKVTLSTSYYIFKLISTHPITHNLPTTPSTNTSSLFWVAGKNGNQDGLVFKAANYNTTDHQPTPVKLSFEELDKGAKAELTLLTTSEGPYGYNDPAIGNNVVVTTRKVLTADSEGAFNFEIPELSVAVLDTGRDYGKYLHA